MYETSTETARKLLVLRLDHIGDCVLFSGALKHIRVKWKDARIDLCVRPHIQNLFEACPHVSSLASHTRLYPWQKLRKSRQKGSWKLAALLQSRLVPRVWYPRYDLVLCPQSCWTEELLESVYDLSAIHKVGFSGAMLNPLHLRNASFRPENVFTDHIQLQPEDHWVSEIERNRSFLRLLGCEAEDIQPEFWLTQADMAFAKESIPPAASLGIFPGSTSKFRRWPVEKWQELIRSQKECRVIVGFGGADECALVSDVFAGIQDMELSFVNLAGKTTLRQLAACIKRCRAMVSMETSALHMAVALGVPTVGLMGGHHYGRYYPWGDRAIHRGAYVDWDCFPCRGHCQYRDYRCVREISVGYVLYELQEALAVPRASSRMC